MRRLRKREDCTAAGQKVFDALADAKRQLRAEAKRRRKRARRIVTGGVRIQAGERKAIARRLAMVRKDLGFGKKETARILGLHEETWSSWERGKQIPDLPHLAMLCRVLGCSMDFIVFGKEQEDASKHSDS